jgi:hypothetical protein
LLWDWDSLHHLYGVGFVGENPSDLAADSPLLETWYPMRIWDLNGMLCSAYKQNQIFLRIFIERYSYMIS